MTLAVGTVLLDSASSIDPQKAHAEGARGQFRYSSGAGNNQSATQWKLTNPGEINKIANTGSLFIANSEWYETRITEGAAAGAADGAADLAFWKSRGLSKGSSLYVSWDAAPSPSKYAGVEAYLRAYNKALDGYYVNDGLYAGIPALVHFSQLGLIKHGWIPEGASWSVTKQNLSSLGISAPPAVTTWDLWFPTKSQIAPAMKFLLAQLHGHKLVSCVWQNGNKWFSNSADENVVLISGPLGAHNETSTVTAPSSSSEHKTTTKPHAPTTKPDPHGPMHGHAVPRIIARGTNDYFGLISGPKESHGGYHANEKPYIKLIQQQLIYMGYVPGVHDIHSGWADGVFEQPTKDAVTRFQKAHMPGTTYWGQVWFDDWAKLASF